MIGLVVLNAHRRFLEELVVYECKKMVLEYLRMGWDRC